MKPWLQTALRADVMRRALKAALIVGTLVVAINYADRFLAGTLVAADYLKMLLTYFVPYGVATWAAVGAIHDKRNAG